MKLNYDLKPGMKVDIQKTYIAVYDNNNEIYWESSYGYWVKREYDANNNEIYWENSTGYWKKREYDANNNQIYWEDSDGYWKKREYDANNNQIYWEDSTGYWVKLEYDANNNEIYYENRDGDIIDNRPKTELTLKEIADKFGIDVKKLRIKGGNNG